MTLRLYNTFTRQKEDFTPLEREGVRIYVCGPTVYDLAHIGNARPIIVFDVLFRLLRHLYGEEHVTYVRNVTDIDDKINARAAERGIPIRQLTDETFADFKKDISPLGCLEPTLEPRATEYVPAMVAIIEKLIARNHAYIADGHVLFHVPSMPDYGSLSRRSLDEMIAGARVDVAPYKKDPMDFVLWKPSTSELPGWDSPWGRGRPGWHIECSAMSWKLLGERFDIHGGGIDLIFPHHENEIAQSHCAFETSLMAKVWMHNGFLQVEGRKMAKSEGNFITIRELLGKRTGPEIRYAMLKTHYRSPLDWKGSDLEVGRRVLQSWGRTVRDRARPSESRAAKKVDQSTIDALCDDLNTSEVILQRLNDLHQKAKVKEEHASSFRDTLDFLGFGNIERYRQFDIGAPAYVPLDKANVVRRHELEISEFRVLAANSMFERSSAIASDLKTKGLKVETDELGGVAIGFADKDKEAEEAKIKSLVAERKAARAAKDWKTSDRIRDELANMGIAVKDKDGETDWEVRR